MSTDPGNRRSAAVTPPAANWLRLDDDRLTAERFAQSGPVRRTAAAPSEWPVLPGYEILGVLGQGGMGVVYQARHRDLDRVVALKMLLHNDAAGLARFQTEAESIARLQHPNIVQVYEISAHNGLPFFTLEYVDGGNLRERLRGGPLAPVEAAALLERLARAVQAAHERGVLHRDLKPANILLTRDGVPKIADFGLARRLEGDPRRTRTGLVLGTPAYMAPEQLGGPKPAGPPADIYALGVILYEAVSGRPPFESASPTDLLFQVGLREPIAPSYWHPQVPRPLETICLKCLSKAPADRYTSAAALADDLQRFLDGKPVRAHRASRLTRWCRAHPWRALLTTAAILLATALLAGLTTGIVGLQRQLANAKAETLAAQDTADQARAETDFAQVTLVSALDQLRLKQDALTQRRGKERAALDQLSTYLLDTAKRCTEVREDQKQALQLAAASYEELAAVSQREGDNPIETAAVYVRAARLRHKLGEQPRTELAYRHALTLLEKAKDEPALTSTRAQRGHIHGQLGLLLKDQQRWPEAESEFRRGRDLYVGLVAEMPANVEHRWELAQAHNNLGVLLNSVQRPSESETEQRQALDLLTRLAAEVPQRPQFQQQAALSHANLAILHRSRNRPDEALSEYRIAQQLQKRLLLAHPAVVEYRVDRANVHNCVALLLAEQSKWSEAEKEHRQALALREQLVAEFPRTRAYSVDAAGSCCNLGHLMKDSGRPEDALDWYQKAILVLRPLVDRDPQLETGRRFLRNAHFGRARALDALDRPKSSVPDWEQAVHFSPERERPPYRASYAEALARMGDANRALAVVNDVANDPTLPPELLYQLACTCGRAVALVPDVPVKREPIAARGVALLQRASATGYFQTPARLETLLSEECLAPLRGRADFNKLLTDIKSRFIPDAPPSKP